MVGSQDRWSLSIDVGTSKPLGFPPHQAVRGQCNGRSMVITGYDDPPMCKYDGKPCLEYDQDTKKVINKCFMSVAQIQHSQTLALCTQPYDGQSMCAAAIDNNLKTRVRLGKGGSFLVQSTTMRNYGSLDLWRPPTGLGGETTADQNLFHFRVQCYVGTGDGSIDDPRNWFTLLDTAQRLPAKSIAALKAHTNMYCADEGNGVKCNRGHLKQWVINHHSPESQP